MDFLEIRRKAKERAAAAEAGQAREAPAGAAPAAGPRPPPPAPAPSAAPPEVARDAAPVLQEADVVAGKLAAELQGIADRAEPPPAEPDPRFTTWRPGSGERPFLAEPEPQPAPKPAPSDFAVIDPAVLRPPRAAEGGGPLAVLPITPPRPAEPPREPERRAGPISARRSPSPARDPLEEFFYRDDEEIPELVALPAEVEPVEAFGPEDASLEEFLTFELGTEEYAVPIERVREVLKAQPITEVPRAPVGILGVVTVRGEVVAVFDPRRRLGLPGPPPPEGCGRIVIVDDGEGACGLLVDAVASVVRLARGSIEPCPQGIGGASADCLAGIGRERNRLFTVLDLPALLRRSPAAPRGGRTVHAGA
jgi:purine-binding chemotaxis protein CheW